MNGKLCRCEGSRRVVTAKGNGLIVTEGVKMGPLFRVTLCVLAVGSLLISCDGYDLSDKKLVFLTDSTHTL